MYTLKKKFDKATAAGVRCFNSLSGTIGSALTQCSTATNARADRAATSRNAQTYGLDQGISSAVLSVMETRKEPTEMTSVRDPSQSMRASFWRHV